MSVRIALRDNDMMYRCKMAVIYRQKIKRKRIKERKYEPTKPNLPKYTTIYWISEHQRLLLFRPTELIYTHKEMGNLKQVIENTGMAVATALIKTLYLPLK